MTASRIRNIDQLIGRLVFALAAMAAICMTPAASARQGPEPVITIRLETDRPGPVINRNIFGQFAEHLGTGIYGGVWVGEESEILNVRGIRTDVVTALKALQIPNVRWPGGCFADEYHWRDGIGPQAGRVSRVNTNWGGVAESNAFGSHEFFDFIDQIGSEAFLSINVGSGTVQEAADWMEYLTGDAGSTLGRERTANGHQAPYKVSLLGLGNESWACGGGMSAEFYTERMKLFSRFVHNFNRTQAGDSKMLRVAVGPEGDDTRYTEAVMAAWKARNWAWDVEGLSIHFYTNNGWPPAYNSIQFGEREYAELLNHARHMDTMLRANEAIMDRYDPEKKVALIVDEWGVWLAPLPGTDPGFLAQQVSLRDAIIAAMNINIFARHADRVRGANIAQMVNVLQAMILTDGPRMALTPTYHVFRMYTPFQDAVFVPVGLDAGSYSYGDIKLPRIDAVAARDKHGALWLAMINIDPARPATVRLAGDYALAKGEVLTAPAVNAVNTIASPNAVHPAPYSAKRRDGALDLVLPPAAIVVVQVS